MFNEKRRLEVSSKIQQMAAVLVKEGLETKDYVLHQVGSMLGIVGTVFLNEKDMFIFSELCTMFSAKKILDSMKEVDDGNFFDDLLKKNPDEPTGDEPETDK